MGRSENSDRGKLYLYGHKDSFNGMLYIPLQSVKVLRSESFSVLMGLISSRDFIDVIMAERSDDISFTCGTSHQK